MSQTPYTERLQYALQAYYDRETRREAALTVTKDTNTTLAGLITDAGLSRAGWPELAAGDRSLQPPDALNEMEKAAELARDATERLEKVVKEWKGKANYGAGAMGCGGILALLGGGGVVLGLDNEGILLWSFLILIAGILTIVVVRGARARPGTLETLARDAHVSAQRALGLGTAVRQQTVAQLAQNLPQPPTELTGLPWTATPWGQWQPRPPGGPLGGEYRLGRLGITQGHEPPFVVPLLAGRGLAFVATGNARARAAAAVQSLVLRLLATTPPGQVRLTFIDPIGRGNNAAGFMHLKDHLPDMISGQAWAEGRQIEQALADLTNQMDNLIQQYLRNVYPTIAEYNAQAAVPEPYRVLVIFDFPANFSETAARYLVSLAENGPRCGIYPIILCDPSKPLPYGFDADDLLHACQTIEEAGPAFLWDKGVFAKFPILLDQPPPEALFNRIVGAVGAGAKQASVVEVKYSQIMPARDTWWRATTREVFSAPLGPAGATRIQQLTLGKGTAQHGLLAGRTGSGKSNLLHVLITSAALAYPPSELELYLIDFKEGVEFKPYATSFLPHARVVAIESEREFGLSVLEGLERELDRRGKLFRDRGVQSLPDFRTRYPNEPLPRILLVVDEFQVFFAEDDALAARCGALLDKLVRQGRSFGIHLLLGSQTLAGAYALARSTMEQMGVRVALQCSEADSRVILAEDNPAARLLSRPGEAIYNAKNGIIEANENFQVAWLPDDVRASVLGTVRDMARAAQFRRSQPLIVFEGRAAARLNKNMRLATLLGAPSWPPPDRKALAWLGEPVAIADPTAAVFRRQSGSNLLVVGRDEELAAGMVTAALFSLAAQLSRQQARFYVLDFSAIDAPAADLLASLPLRLPHGLAHVRGKKTADSLRELHHALKQRLEADEVTVAKRASLFLVLHGLHRARDLRPDDADGYTFNYNDAQPAELTLPQMLAELIKEGPEMGIHTIAWADNVPNLLRVLDRRLLREFDMRVALQMTADDSATLLDNDPAASRLRDFRGYFYSQEDNRLEKFSPYGPPAKEWLDDVAARLAAR